MENFAVLILIEFVTIEKFAKLRNKKINGKNKQLTLCV